MCLRGGVTSHSEHHARCRRETRETQGCGLHQEASDWFAGREIRVQSATVGYHEEVPTT